MLGDSGGGLRPGRGRDTARDMAGGTIALEPAAGASVTLRCGARGKGAATIPGGETPAAFASDRRPAAAAKARDTWSRRVALAMGRVEVSAMLPRSWTACATYSPE